MTEAKELIDNDHHEFKLMLHGNTDLEKQLIEFKEACDSHEKKTRKKHKRRYYHLGLMARIVYETTFEEMQSLLKNGARTFLVDAVIHKFEEFQTLLERINEAFLVYQSENESIRLVTALALELHGDVCRVSRLRNNCSVLLVQGAVLTLTTDESYKYSGFKEITHIINLKYYIKTLKLNNEIKIGREIVGKIVKILGGSVSILILESGLLNSYDFIELPNQCHSLNQQSSMELFENDLNIAKNANVNYVLLPKIRCKKFLATLRKCLTPDFDFKLIGAIDLQFVSSKMLDLLGIIKLLDYLWIPDMFCTSYGIQNYIYQDVVPIAKSLNKPIIGSVPLERCSDFKNFENHDFLFKIDTIFIEKSRWCNKYPLIVKKLMPITNFHIGVVDNAIIAKNIITSYHTVVNFIIRTICTIECHAILIHSQCEMAFAMLSRVEIYCPVYIMLPLDDESEEDCKMKLARSLNLRRNVRALLYTKEMNEGNYKPFEFAIEYTRKAGLLETGDFYITIEVCKEDKNDFQLGIGEDVVILRASYFPPPKNQ